MSEAPDETTAPHGTPILVLPRWWRGALGLYIATMVALLLGSPLYPSERIRFVALALVIAGILGPLLYWRSLVLRRAAPLAHTGKHDQAR